MHERSEKRTDYRNGTRERELLVRIGTLKLEVPRHRNQPFHTMIFENYQRSEAALIATMVQMVVMGVSTRKVGKLVETLCGTDFSKSTVSALCKTLDGKIDEFRNQPIKANYPFLMVDATYFKAREEHKIKSKAFLVAIGINEDGEREILGFNTYDAEENFSWEDFLQSLKKRGLTSVNMIISDAHKSIPYALKSVYPEAAWQRCQVHFIRNILDKVPKKYKEGLAFELREMFTAKTLEEAERKKESIIDDYTSVAPGAMEVLEKGFDDSMTVISLPDHMRKNLRSTNMLERLNREFKRRSDVIQIFPNADSITRLIGAVAIEYNAVFSCKQKLFSRKTFAKIQKTMCAEFIRIAREQQLRNEAA